MNFKEWSDELKKIKMTKDTLLKDYIGYKQRAVLIVWKKRDQIPEYVANLTKLLSRRSQIKTHKTYDDWVNEIKSLGIEPSFFINVVLGYQNNGILWRWRREGFVPPFVVEITKAMEDVVKDGENLKNLLKIEK